MNRLGRNGRHNARGHLHRCAYMLDLGNRDKVPCAALIWTSECEAHADSHGCEMAVCGFDIVPEPMMVGTEESANG